MAVYFKTNIYLTVAAFTVTCSYAAFLLYNRLKKRNVPATEAFELIINLVSDTEKCEPLVNELRRRSMDYNAIGFDCEWVTRGSRQPVALLQLSTHDGYCVLFRLNLMDALPLSLIKLLEDMSIYKVGVAPLNDANYLELDHGLSTNSTIDLRHFVEMCGYTVGGLAHLSETLLGVVLNKSLKIRCGNWDAETLTPAQLHYAASDAHAAIRIFVKLINDLNKPTLRQAWCSPDCEDNIWDVLDDVCTTYADYNYKYVQLERKDGRNGKKLKKPKDISLDSKRYPHLKRSKPFYENCLLQAPDGELLSTCDHKKAQWYVAKGLADLIQEDPLTVRLRFEPASRDMGKFYQQHKENRCVVCGETDSYIRKNVVPREYRKYFPDIIKDHSSHDVVLLCGRCHQRSNMRDLALRERLAALAAAPLPQRNRKRDVEDPAAKKVRMAARALHRHHSGKHALPSERRRALEAVVLGHYTERRDLTAELLEEAVNLSVMVQNEHYNTESHGQTVARHFQSGGGDGGCGGAGGGGLLRLEELWRTHFLTTMRPRHMPALWSVSHNYDRLRVKWNEGRLSKEDLQSIGVEEL